MNSLVCGGRRRDGGVGSKNNSEALMFGVQEKARLGVHGYMRGRNRPVFEALGSGRIFDFLNG